jgi:alpha-1,2-mannosyltransferase
MVVAVDCLRTAMPDVWVDSTGFAFSIAAARAHGCGTAAYVHYPTISTDMLLRVKSRSADYNHSSEIAASATASIAKWVYYWAFAVIYGAVGCMTQVVMVNSSWTRNHITKLWLLRTPRIVYPPCDTLELKVSQNVRCYCALI